MPVVELASEKALREVMGCGAGMGDGGVEWERKLAHHFMSSWVLRGGVCGMKGLFAHMVSIASMLVR